MSDVDLTLEEALEDLSSAEEFLDYFGVEYDAKTVQVNRLHILQRYHNYIKAQGPAPADETSARAFYTQWLTQAYLDFVQSDALTERVFVVLQKAAGTSFVPLESLSSPKV
ncbi:nitrogenase-stabilizing/protective protein NifW [Zoogloea sp. LCSB751]|uniref:nitrogenase-stabilizing/protective protein NifW n=1 Tax=Zoogloea sp. LCSB751 TaxID=1965277 RepID=UPI0009A54251|nr:nitrogenase-stabilizing/protective protein NifW [Zoogloea sp. LCSB751]